jgi:hypothetical protein
MKQVLGAKKHKRCEGIAGKSYRVCYTSGNYGHGVAECWYGDGETVHDADWVNYVAQTVEPKYRDGRVVPQPTATDVLLTRRDELRQLVAELSRP